ncbi:NADPH-dependent 1-acyl dihydroxyacetone phosphate reductase [Tilletia horrida]|uniref:NADPH-dependent 1-acyl dihydroxyacetone phosphate reductase n=1 Tax=Tilletia horrida TaxID=155126 RepID=A0AAN6GST4_9BASI|nr:NADPH-dependent 1-acyl dihydroxyacetone phosphate reductase [Tilletia horrida]KAK0556135.1 NADPH-dependent 1-acyl dihydroxyacetone phosphate reductase [Tilletia horrida]
MAGAIVDNRKVVLITGTSSGIGRGFVEELSKSPKAQKQYQVFASARNIDKLAFYPPHVERVALDVTDEDSVQAAIDSVIRQAGRIDVLINNAGASNTIGAAIEVPLSNYRACFEANFFGLIRVTQAVAPHMIRQGSGTIINIGSTVGLTATPWAAGYSASKAAVHSWSDALRVELAPFNVKVVVVAPGAIKSAFGETATSSATVPSAESPYYPAQEVIKARAMFSQGSYATPTAVFAKHVLKNALVKKPRAYIVYGAKSFGAFLAWYLPAWVTDAMKTRMFSLGILYRARRALQKQNRA